MKIYNLITNLFILLIKIYKLFISPLLPSSCRFYPTCSSYAIISMQKYGALKGTFLTVKRLLRCHPFCSGGYDPVP